jgi:hypothetical protein
MSDNIFNPADYEDGTYQREHSTKTMTMSIKRGDTRHGETSYVTIGKNRKLKLSLSEARSLKAFLDRELQLKAR